MSSPRVVEAKKTERNRWRVMVIDDVDTLTEVLEISQDDVDIDYCSRVCLQ